jgi:hypothetical protein
MWIGFKLFGIGVLKILISNSRKEEFRNLLNINFSTIIHLLENDHRNIPEGHY